MLSNNPVIVLGIPRSGTSYIAKVLHADMGIEMCRSVTAPYPGRDDFDWEDLELQNQLVVSINMDEVYSAHKFKIYLSKRREAKRAHYWGVKSPLLCMYPNVIPKDAFVILTKRNLHDCIRSVNKLPINVEQKKRVLAIQDTCRKSLFAIKPNLTLDVDVLSKNEIRKIMEDKIDEYYHPNTTHILSDSDGSE